MKFVVEIEVEHIAASEDELEHYKVKKVVFEGAEVESELSMDRSGAYYWPFFSHDSGYTLSVIEDKG